MRDLPPETLRYLAGTGGMVYVVCGLSFSSLWFSARAQLDHPGPTLVLAGVAVCFGIVTVLHRWVASEWLDRVYPLLAVTLVFGAVVFITLGLRLAGVGRWNVGAGMYVVTLTFAFYVLKRRWAVSLIGFIGVGYGVVLAAPGGVPSPGTQWCFLMAVAIASSVVLASLVARSDLLASSERDARLALAEINDTLETRVEAQVEEVERLNLLRRFLAPQVAEAVLSADGVGALEPHRRLIAVLFCDLRGFTHFSATSEPEEVVYLIESYYQVSVDVLSRFHATIGAFVGDGVMAYFGDPVPCGDPAGTALDAARALRDELDLLLAGTGAVDQELGFGIGIAYGHATLGMIGAGGRCDYTALGSVVNLASRLCAEASSREIVLDRRAHAAVRGHVDAEPCSLRLKGFVEPVRAHRLSATPMCSDLTALELA